MHIAAGNDPIDHVPVPPPKQTTAPDPGYNLRGRNSRDSGWRFVGTAPKRCVAAARYWVSVSGSTCRSWLHASSALFGGGYRSFRYHGRWNGRSALPWAYSLTLFVFKSFRFPSCLYTSTPQPLLFGSPVPRDALFTDAVAGVTGRHGHERRILAFPTTGRVW